MPSEGRSKNFGDGTFVSGSGKYVKEQYNTNKALLDAVGRDECAKFFESGCTEDF